jgi:hypothetical protein
MTTDFNRLTAEIEEEVRQRRAAGDFTPELERSLDALFDRHAPAASAATFDEALEQAQRASFVHADVPVASRRRLARLTTRLLRPIMAFYLRFLAQQVTALGAAVTRALGLLGQRVDSLEDAAPAPPTPSLLARLAVDLSPWMDTVSTALDGLDGRVLHADCGDGALVAKLVAAGRDAYGVSWRAEPDATGLDLRADDLLEHLDRLPDRALGGLVLSGVVDILALGSLRSLIDLAAVKLATGGRLVVVSFPTVDPVLADLSPGRPLHAETWAFLLDEAGFAPSAIHRAAGGYAVVAQRA